MRNHGGQIQALANALGIKLPERVYDFSASLSPLGMPPALQGIVDNWKNQLEHYPSPDAELACAALADVHGLKPEQVLCGNGSTELFALVLLASGVTECDVVEPCWSGYAEACASAGVACKVQSAVPAKGEALILASPNNPDGSCLDVSEVLRICEMDPKRLVILDLAFDDFLHSPSNSPWWKKRAWPANLVRIKSLTKFFGIAGLRLGFLATTSENLHQKLRTRILPWNVNGIAQWAAERVYADDQWQEQARAEAIKRKGQIAELLARNGFDVKPCAAWVLATPRDSRQASDVQRWFLERGICVRKVSQTQLRFGLPAQECVDALEQVLTALVQVGQKRTPAILVAGTSSDAGKSVIAAGLCAVLRTQGLSPMPYKAQNMSNHAWVTAQGGEIGWAQAVQAFAAGVQPHVDMNPVLLKPGAASKSHVVHCGVDQGAMDVHQYHASFAEHRQVALDAYDRIAKQAGVVVLEGAGGIAEINLRHRDLSNREAPLHAHARTVLVTDIERGGAFASLYGSWAMLDDAMQKQVCGFIINRFRGDASLLENGIEELKLRTGVPVLGVIPYQENLQLGQEDSMGFGEDALPPDTGIRIGVVRLPHLSNGNDWTALQSIAGVSVFCSSDPHKLSQADALIVPGTRTTIADLRWLKATGISEFLVEWNRKKRSLLAICGGMQMLGEYVCDEQGVEDLPGSLEEGLHVFPLRTMLQRQGKIVRQRREIVTSNIANTVPWLKAGEWIEGYEIHCGRSELVKTTENQGVAWLDGWIANQGLLWGTYWHGVFHQHHAALAWVQAVAQSVGKPWDCISTSPTEIATQVPGFLRAGIADVQKMIEAHVRWKEILR